MLFWHRFLDGFWMVLDTFWAPFWIAEGFLLAYFFITKLTLHFDQKKVPKWNYFLTIWPPFFDDFWSFGASGAWEPHKWKKMSWEHGWEHGWEHCWEFLGGLSLQQK